MADPVLHIKDSYYFEVPKALWPRRADDREFPDVWVRLDPQYQDWEFERLYASLAKLGAITTPEAEAKSQWHQWQHHDHADFGKPFSVYLEEYEYPRNVAAFNRWEQSQTAKAIGTSKSGDSSSAEKADFATWLNDNPAAKDLGYKEFSAKYHDSAWRAEWNAAKKEARSVEAYESEGHVKDWSANKVAAYNNHLSGKIVIPQPFGELRNLYQKEPGWDNIAISKFMIIELVVALIVALLFSWLGRRVAHGDAPKGKPWNLLEMFCVFIRDEIAEPAIGHHDAHRFTPLLWNIFFFILGMNLFGMLPWLGAPTGTWAVTFAVAVVTFLAVVVSGMLRFGVLGFFKNQVPHMDLPIYMAIFIKPAVLAIELLGLVIKHAVLSVRLLANMVAGHMVLLGILGMAFGLEAAIQFADAPTWQWGVTATLAVVGSALLSLLEVFVAFLQAYVFTLLSALFIGAAIHHH
jgi:F-type H+-transporting ATPase subunit a